MNLREQQEALERQILSSYASLSSETLGRTVEEEKCDIRTDFARDRDESYIARRSDG